MSTHRNPDTSDFDLYGTSIPRELLQMEKAALVLSAYADSGTRGVLSTLYHNYERIPFSDDMELFAPVVMSTCLVKIWDVIESVNNSAAHELRNLVVAVGALWPFADDDTEGYQQPQLEQVTPYARLFGIDPTEGAQAGVLRRLLRLFVPLAVDVVDDWQRTGQWYP